MNGCTAYVPFTGCNREGDMATRCSRVEQHMRGVSTHRFGRKRAVAGRVVAALLLCLILVPAAAAQVQSAPYCAQGQVPEFTHGLASLAAQLGTFMGQPTECEHQDRASGDTLQATTTGLAYYRHAANDTTVFTDGQSHVALTDRV
jgi:hypothetical protein